jgi:hypothetical protein
MRVPPTGPLQLWSRFWYHCCPLNLSVQITTSDHHVICDHHWAWQISWEWQCISCSSDYVKRCRPGRWALSLPLFAKTSTARPEANLPQRKRLQVMRIRKEQGMICCGERLVAALHSHIMYKSVLLLLISLHWYENLRKLIKDKLWIIEKTERERENKMRRNILLRGICQTWIIVIVANVASRFFVGEIQTEELIHFIACCTKLRESCESA